MGKNTLNFSKSKAFDEINWNLNVCHLEGILKKVKSIQQVCNLKMQNENFQGRYLIFPIF